MRPLRIAGLFFAPLLIGVLLLIPLPLSAQRQTNPNPQPQPGNPNIETTQPRTYVVAGMVSDAQTNIRLDSVKVELREFTGGTVATVFTSGEGNFEFENIAEGSYLIFVEQVGYASAQQNVDVMGPTHGILVELRSIGSASGVAVGKATVSKRELLIPHKAHDAMEKGLTLLYAKSDYPGSVKQFERATQEYPDYYEAYTEMGVAYVKLKDATNAERVLRKALDLSDQQYVDALVSLSSLYTDNQRFTEAEPLARKAVELDGNSSQANFELARVLLGIGQADEAEKSVLAAIKLQPQNPILFLLLANVHIALQNYPALVDDLDNYLKLAPAGQFADQARKQRDEIQQQLQNSQASPAEPDGQHP
jgi:tetratricopeptide (TPR) repeat protein